MPQLLRLLWEFHREPHHNAMTVPFKPHFRCGVRDKGEVFTRAALQGSRMSMGAQSYLTIA